MHRYLLAAIIVVATLISSDSYAQTALDKATGGGWFNVGFVPTDPSAEQEANLGFTVRKGKRGPEGHLNYHNRLTGLNVNGPVTSASRGECPLNGLPSAIFRGNCDDGSCSFWFEVVDAGEPGKGRDEICQYEVTKTNQGTDSNFERFLNKGNFDVR
jgi:hypothetical protein